MRWDRIKGSSGPGASPLSTETADPRSNGLDVLLPQVARWFSETFGEPTAPQRAGWPAVARGENTLIFAPTGSGKTLAAFLGCLDYLWRIPREAKGTRILYLSPLKALNQDIWRNLQLPLVGILETAEAMGKPLRSLDVAVRTGDTTASARQKMLRKPPEILITTPESLHLLLTSRAREGLRSVSHVIIDEIHALCPNKRGVFLALLLERLEAITSRSFVRIGLSATQRPLEEVARYLGGSKAIRGPDGTVRYQPRPVTIVDSGQRKAIDLEVSAGYDRPGPMAAGTVWPAIERRLVDLIQTHRSTIIFANNRRVVERLTAHLNELAGTEDVGATEGRPAFARSHHGSLNLPERRETEEALKRGELAAVVATASLELGIDMGAVDLVCQIESPGSVARGLQRVGRAGHVVGRTSKGRILAKTPGDLLESAALCRAMIAGEVESLRVPTNCLDVLAQQVVASVAVEACDAGALYERFRCAYPYRNLSAEAFESVLMMASGRFPVGTFGDLRPRISWDRVHNRLLPLPGTARLALSGGGTIPDTGQYPLYLGEGGPKLGELDEEFVHERRVGETFSFGSATWRIEAIEPLKVVVSRAEGQSAMMPFWRGEDAPRTAELGEKVGKLCRELAASTDADALAAECRLDPPAARALSDYIARQVRLAGVAPDDRTVLMETFRDPAGEVGLAILTPFGGKLHQGLKLALQGRLRDRFGVSVSCLHADDGLLIRLPKTDDLPLDLLDNLTPATAEALIRSELGESALFGLRFRQNAGRALLLPKPDPSKRTPLWLQRLRAKDLLQVVRKFPDFPIVVETYRECLEDDLDLPRLRAFLQKLADGSIRVVTREGEIASPFANELIFRFTQNFLYEWDEPKRPDRSRSSADVSSLVDSLIDPGAVARVDAHLRGVGLPPRSVDEMAEQLRQLGDLALDELDGPMAGFLETLRLQGRATTIEISSKRRQVRWVGTEEAELYLTAFSTCSEDRAAESIVRRYLRTRALVGLDDLLARFPIDPARATEWLERWAEEGSLVRLDDGTGTRWADPKNLDQVRRLSIALRRKEIVAVVPEVYSDFLARRSKVHPETRFKGKSGVNLVLEALQGFAATLDTWENELLPRRVEGFLPSWLDEEVASGAWIWRARGDGASDPKIAFVARDFAGAWPAEDEPVTPSAEGSIVLDALDRAGASFAIDLARRTGLEPSKVHWALDELARLGLVTNDRLDPLRPAAKARREALAGVGRVASGRPRLGSRRMTSLQPEGRWSRIVPVAVDESSLLAWADLLLARHGVLTRETVAIDPWAPPWRELAPLLARAELRGKVRRGYFVEGLSGVQYAANDSAEELALQAGRIPGHDPALMLSTVDPANLYGSGAPLDIPLLEGGTARLIRSVSNLLVLIAGRPVLIIEGNGKRLTGLASASEADTRAALALLPSLAGPSRRVLKVETFNASPALASPVAPWLSELGFVRDPPGLAYYAGW
jgi:ATP-dependent Lhr-like helicase